MSIVGTNCGLSCLKLIIRLSFKINTRMGIENYQECQPLVLNTTESIILN